MIDQTIPYLPVVMEKNDPENYPRFSLPEGFRFSFYHPGLEEGWCRLQVEVGHFDSLSSARQRFETEFACRPGLLKDRLLFALREGEVVGSAALWEGSLFGQVFPRLHWVAVSDRYGGRGIAKALLTRLFDRYRELGLSGKVYLTSQTNSYPALDLYRRFGFGFSPEKPALLAGSQEEYAASLQEAKAIINGKLTNRAPF